MRGGKCSERRHICQHKKIFSSRHLLVKQKQKVGLTASFVSCLSPRPRLIAVFCSRCCLDTPSLLRPPVFDTFSPSCSPFCLSPLLLRTGEEGLMPAALYKHLTNIYQNEE